MRSSLVPALLLYSSLLSNTPLAAQAPVAIDGRLELFVDDALIESMSAGVALQVQQPEPREVVLVTGEPWEGNTSAYYTILHDHDAQGRDLYRMYYRGSHAVNMKSAHEEVTCYAESRDGRHWEKPSLGLFDWDGSKDNNIVWRGIGTHCFAPFIDTNPECPPEVRYKALSRGRPIGSKGLYAFESPDGIHWSLTRDEPVITQGAFDSQNVAFWDPVLEQYVAYSRLFTNGVRAIQRSTSHDFVTWTDPVTLTYGDAPAQHLYTNAIRPCPGAPHIRIGFPTRYLPKTQQVEPIFMASRDGLAFRRYDDPVIPQTAPEDRAGNRSNYMAHGLLALPDSPNEWSVYGTEAYYAGPDSRLRRFVYRRNGLVALNGTGTVVTRPLVTTGTALELHYDCADDGELEITVSDANGQSLGAIALTGRDDNGILRSWSFAAPADDAAQRTIRIRFDLRNARVYAMQLHNGTESDD